MKCSTSDIEGIGSYCINKLVNIKLVNTFIWIWALKWYVHNCNYCFRKMRKNVRRFVKFTQFYEIFSTQCKVSTKKPKVFIIFVIISQIKINTGTFPMFHPVDASKKKNIGSHNFILKRIKHYGSEESRVAASQTGRTQFNLLNPKVLWEFEVLKFRDLVFFIF